MGTKRALGAGAITGPGLGSATQCPGCSHTSITAAAGGMSSWSPQKRVLLGTGTHPEGGRSCGQKWAARQLARVPGQPTLTDARANSRRDAPGRGALPRGLAGAGARGSRDSQPHFPLIK